MPADEYVGIFLTGPEQTQYSQRWFQIRAWS